MITNKAKLIYKNVNIFDRFITISESFPSKHPLEKYDRLEAEEIFSSLNCNFKYYKRESFFGLSEEGLIYKFKLNVSLKYGIVEIIMWGKNKETEDQYGGPLSRIVKQIQIADGVCEIKKIPYPRFSSFAELIEISKEVYSLFEDFKKEIQKVELAA